MHTRSKDQRENRYINKRRESKGNKDEISIGKLRKDGNYIIRQYILKTKTENILGEDN